MGDAMSAGREALDDLGPAVLKARIVRYIGRDGFGDLTGDELDAAARHLRAIAYSCTEGAKTLEAILRDRCAEAIGK